MPGDVGDLALLDAGGVGAALDDQRDGLVGEPAVGEVIAAAHLPEHGPAVDAGSVEVAAQRPDRAAVGPLSIGDPRPWAPSCSWSAFERRIVTSSPRAAWRWTSSTSSATSSERLSAAANPSNSSSRSRSPASVKVSIGSTSRASGLSSSGWAQRPPAALTADPGEDGGDGARVAGVGLVLRAVRGGDRGGALVDRDRAQLTVGLDGQERGDRLR